MIDLTGKVALVTGGSRGIGRATSLRLAQAGADVVVNYVSSKTAAMEVAGQIRQLGRRAWVVKADVSEEEDAAAMIGFVQQEIAQLDILISNAATGGFHQLLDSKRKHFEHAISTNVLSVVYLVRAAQSLLVNKNYRTKVIALSSHGSEMALPMYGVVGTSKAALESLCRHLTLELGHLGVNINVVKAGLVKTDSTARLPDSERMFARRVDKAMMGSRTLEASDVADVILFLASPLSDLIQGQTITVDGGAEVHV